uniref:Uncharacterized protein n=1 Tax=Pseudonaja textilis TaxID=8673 RepID=A0A670YTU2_PSETE
MSSIPIGSDSLVVCDVDPALIEKLKKFRFQKETNNTALISLRGTRNGRELRLHVF